MRRFSGIMIVILVTISFLALPGYAQNDSRATYISFDGAFTFSYPEKWVQRDYGFGIFLSNTSALPGSFEKAQVETGELQLRIYPPLSVSIFQVGDNPVNLENQVWALIYRLIVDVTPDELETRSVEIIDVKGQDAQLISAVTNDSEHITALAMELDSGFPVILIAITVDGEWDRFEADVFEVASTIHFEDRPPIFWPDEGLSLDETVVLAEDALTFNYPTGWTMVNFVEEHVTLLANSPSVILSGSNELESFGPDQFVGAFHSPIRLHQFFHESTQWDGVEIAKEFADAQQDTANVSISPPYNIEQLTLNDKPAVVLHNNTLGTTCERLAYSVVVIEFEPESFAVFEVMACPAVLLNFEAAAKAIASTLRYLEE